MMNDDPIAPLVDAFDDATANLLFYSIGLHNAPDAKQEHLEEIRHDRYRSLAGALPRDGSWYTYRNGRRFRAIVVGDSGPAIEVQGPAYILPPPPRRIGLVRTDRHGEPTANA